MMKMFVFSLLAFATIGSTAEARTLVDTQYSVSYNSWDRQFSSYYQYTEVTSGCSYSTCYEGFQTSSTVYVRERYYGDYGRVTVYRDSGYTQPYAYYETHHDGGHHRVVRRTFVRHTYVHEPYYYNSHHHYHTHYEPIYVELDFEQPVTKILVGGYLIGIGAVLMAEGAQNDNSAEIAMGAVSAAFGSVSLALASNQLIQESDLQKACQAKDSRL